MRAAVAICTALALLAAGGPSAQMPAAAERLPAGCLSSAGIVTGWLPDVAEGSGQPLPADSRTAVIRGRVVAVGGGQPLPGAQVCVTMRGRDMGWYRIATTDADGRFELGGLALGSYRLAASVEGYVTLAYGQRHAEERPRPIQVMTDGAVIEDILLSLPRVD